MLFNSYIFIFLFFPICLLGFYYIQKKNATYAKLWLIGFSFWFYGYFNVNYLLIMMFSIIINYGIYLVMRNFTEKRKLILAIGILINLFILFYFKYFDFFIENMNLIFKSSTPLRHILLPLGISFFTFQQLSFLVDSYHGEIEECSFVDYSLFVSFFPQLIAGPIVTHSEMMPQFANIGKNRFNVLLFENGMYIFTLGLSKKVLVADTFGKAVDYGYSSIYLLNSSDALLVMLFYTIQIYFDFSGYCDMAIGIGKMFGIIIPVNFNSPYKAVNIIDFWKRWHITLNRFLTRNVYIPLGGNRKGYARMYINLLIVFFVSGLWHGAGFKFIIWGMLHGMLYVLTRFAKNIFKEKQSKENKITRVTDIILTFLFVNVAWVYFRADSVSQANELITKIFTGGFHIPNIQISDAFNLDEFWYVLKVLKLTNFTYSYEIIMIVFTFVILVFVFAGKNVQELASKWKPTVINAIITACLFIWCVVSLSGVSTFLYFNF